MLLCLLTLTMILSAHFPCEAQETANVRELADGSLVVDYKGKKYRGLTGAQLDKIEVQANTLATCKVNESRYQQLVEIANRDVIIAEQQRDREKSNFVHAMSLYEKERELRTEAMQFIPHGKVNGFGGKVFTFLDGPYGQSLFKLVIPTAQFVKVMKQ